MVMRINRVPKNKPNYESAQKDTKELRKGILESMKEPLHHIENVVCLDAWAPETRCTYN